MPPWPRKEAERYLKRVARKNAIRIRWVKGRDWLLQAEAYEAGRLVFIPKPNNGAQLLVALHELGHLLCSMPNTKRTEFDMPPGEWALAMEGAAWAWAAEHIPVTMQELLTFEDYRRSVGIGMWSHTATVADRARTG